MLNVIEKDSSFPVVNGNNFDRIFSIPLAATRKTMVFSSKIYPDWIMKVPRPKFSSDIKHLTPIEKAQQWLLAENYISGELYSDAITRQFITPSPGLEIPEEYYYIEADLQGLPKIYRLQKKQIGIIFSNIPELSKKLDKTHKQSLIHLIDATLSCYEANGFHLDIIGFACGHEPTTVEIIQAYQDPIVKSTNLLLREDGKIAWIDPKISQLTPEIDKIRTELFIEQRNRLLNSRL